jgi:hypothetical protein
MKFSFFRTFVFFIILGTVFNVTLDAKTFNPENYDEVDSKQLTLQLKDFKNKKVFYSGVYEKILTTFPQYVDKSGIKVGKHYYFIISPSSVPVIVKRDKDFDKLVLSLEKGSTVQVYGKIKQFRYKPANTRRPHYYLELAHLKVVALGDKKKYNKEDSSEDIIGNVKAADNNNNKRKNWKKRKLKRAKRLMSK